MMRPYKNEDNFCPVCGGTPDDNTLIGDSMLDGNATIQFECFSCGSTWDVIYNAFAVINLEERHEDTEDGQ